MNTYKILGTTDATDTCGICGRVELKSVTVLSTEEGEIYAGSGCAAKLAGRPVRDIEIDARAADKAAKAQAWADREAASRVASAIHHAAVGGYITATYGDIPKGRTYFHMCQEARKAGLI